MKKLRLNILQKFILLFSIAISIVSCSNEEQNEEINSLKSNEQLINELSQFNNNFNYTTLNDEQAKKWWQTVLQIAAVASGDAAGGAAGVWAAQGLAAGVGAATAGTGYAVVSGIAGVVGAAGGSYAAYCSTGGSCRAAMNNIDPKGESIKYDFPSDFDYLENFGLLHNDVMLNSYLSNNSTEINWLENNIENINEIDYNLLYSSSEFQNLITDINTINSNYKKNGYDTDYLLTQYENNGLINDGIKSILSLYFEATSRAEDFADYKNITSYYVDSIKNSALSNKEKEALYAAFSVSIQSFYLWLNIEI